MSMNFTCNDCENELHDRSNFDVEIISTQNILTVGDTLELYTSLNSNIELELSESTYDNTDQLIDYTIEIFEVIANNNEAFQARSSFKFLNITGEVFIPEARKWEINIQNRCGSTLCEIEYGLIPQRIGYFGLFLKTGRFGFQNDCQSLTLFPTGFQTDENNNQDILDETNLSGVRVNRSFIDNP